MALFKKAPVERFVEAFVKQKKRNVVGINYINKAIALIDKKLGFCCDNPGGILELHTPHDNVFTHTIRMYLNTMSREGNIQSLQRTKTKLQQFTTACCPE
jgi:hypothetical protein